MAGIESTSDLTTMKRISIGMLGIKDFNLTFPLAWIDAGCNYQQEKLKLVIDGSSFDFGVQKLITESMLNVSIRCGWIIEIKKKISHKLMKLMNTVNFGQQLGQFRLKCSKWCENWVNADAQIGFNWPNSWNWFKNDSKSAANERNSDKESILNNNSAKLVWKSDKCRCSNWI